MNYTESLKLALSDIWSHKLRSLLTLLGMIIGVAAFMIVLSVLQGFNKYVDEKIAGIGSDAFSIERFDVFQDFKDTDTFYAAQRRNKELNLDEMEYISERTQTIDQMGAKARPNPAELKVGREILNVQAEGMQPIIAEIENLDADIEEGRFFTKSENDGAVKVCFIGSEVAEKLFPYRSAVGNEIYVNGLPYRVIGVRKERGAVFGFSQDLFVYVPLKTYAANFGPLRASRSLYFVALPKEGIDLTEAVEESRSLMRQVRGLKQGEKDNFGIMTPDAITKFRDRLFGVIFTVIMIVPSIALIVGAIVIMNIMLVAVTERTKEIGIRKAIGARRGDILSQFLFESSVLAALGGLIGLVIAMLSGQVISAAVFPTYIPVWAMFVGIFVPALIGVVAGLFPAWKAASLDPIEALRAD